MIEDYDGATVVDLKGEQIGTVERSYVDGAERVRMVGVKIGRIRTKHRLIPTDDAESVKGELRVPYAKQVVEDSPDAAVEDTLEGEMLERVRAYYVGVRTTAQRRSEDDSRTRPGARPVERGEAPVPDVQETGRADISESTWDEARKLGRVRDLGDTVEVAIGKEELVKRPVVTEVLRIRKSTITEQQQVSEDLRHEDIEVDREGDVKVNVDDQRRS